MFNRDFFFSLARHILTAGAGWLVAKGFADAATAETLIGGIMAALGVGWSWYHHSQQNKLPPASGNPGA